MVVGNIVGCLCREGVRFLNLPGMVESILGEETKCA